MDFGRIAAKEYFLYCFPMLSVFHYAHLFRDLVFRIMHFLFPIPACSVWRCVCIMRINLYFCYIYMDLFGFKNKSKQTLVCVAIPYGLVMWDLPMGLAYWWPTYLAWLSDIHVALVSYPRQLGACVRDLVDGLPSYLCHCRVCWWLMCPVSKSSLGFDSTFS